MLLSGDLSILFGEKRSVPYLSKASHCQSWPGLLNVRAGNWPSGHLTHSQFLTRKLSQEKWYNFLKVN